MILSRGTASWYRLKGCKDCIYSPRKIQRTHRRPRAEHVHDFHRQIERGRARVEGYAQVGGACDGEVRERAHTSENHYVWSQNTVAAAKILQVEPKYYAREPK